MPLTRNRPVPLARASRIAACLASVSWAATAIPVRAFADEPGVADPAAVETIPAEPPVGPVESGEPLAPSPEEAGADHAGEPDRGPFALGVLLGRPLGASAVLFLAPDHALQFSLGYDLVLVDAATVTVDYAWHPFPIFGNSVVEFTWHVGIGASLGVWPAGHDYDCRDTDPSTEGIQAQCARAWVQPGVRLPLGIEMLFRSFPLEIFAEFGGGVVAYPVVEFLGQGGMGARWYF